MEEEEQVEQITKVEETEKVNIIAVAVLQAETNKQKKQTSN
jgi:hypothetical protein